jgi:hypothetical protein
MNLPEILTPEDVAEVLAAVGRPADRTSVARALRQMPVEGVAAPRRRGEWWIIPRDRLTEAVAACLYRRALRSHDRWDADLERCRLDAAEVMLKCPELAGLVPGSLKRAALERRDERVRREEERRRRIAEAVRRRASGQEEAWRRKQQEERELYARIERERAREEHERVMRECYRICYRAAFRSLDLPWGDKRGLPEYEQLRRDFPYDRPGWWQPPPGLFEAVAEDLPKQSRFGYVEPDWSRWIPPYEPGKPWPWRRRDDADAAGAG